MTKKIKATIVAVVMMLSVLVGVTASPTPASALPSSCGGVGLVQGFNPNQFGVRCTGGSGYYMAVAVCTYPKQATKYVVSNWQPAVGANSVRVWAYCPSWWALNTGASYWRLTNTI